MDDDVDEHHCMALSLPGAQLRLLAELSAFVVSSFYCCCFSRSYIALRGGPMAVHPLAVPSDGGRKRFYIAVN